MPDWEEGEPETVEQPFKAWRCAQAAVMADLAQVQAKCIGCTSPRDPIVYSSTRTCRSSRSSS